MKTIYYKMKGARIFGSKSSYIPIVLAYAPVLILFFFVFYSYCQSNIPFIQNLQYTYFYTFF